MKHERKVAQPDRGLEYGHESTVYEMDGPVHMFMHGMNEIPLHWHETQEIIVVLRGTLRMTVGKSLCSLGERDVMIINPFTVHGSTAWDPETLVCGVHLSTDYFECRGLPEFSARQYLCRSFLHGKSFERIANPIRSMVARLLLSSGRVAGDKLARDLLAGMLALFVYRHVPWEAEAKDGASLRGSGGDRVVRIMREVRACNARDFSLAEYAERENVTVSHLSRLFKAFVGIGYRDYVQNVRLDNAATLLREDRMPISDIMEVAGFSNPTHFFRKFRARYGCSPGQYRRRRHGSARPWERSVETMRREIELLCRQLDFDADDLHRLIFGLDRMPSLGSDVSIHQVPALRSTHDTHSC
ncbi:MAG: helix-turn-helix transcriptional regulator [Rhodovulum sp.]|nr:helix-turn-helix transcriptional regulator [Rhodovulum sp.]